MQTCRRVLQGALVCCNVLQCCSVLQCVAEGILHADVSAIPATMRCVAGGRDQVVAVSFVGCEMIYIFSLFFSREVPSSCCCVLRGL